MDDSQLLSLKRLTFLAFYSLRHYNFNPLSLVFQTYNPFEAFQKE